MGGWGQKRQKHDDVTLEWSPNKMVADSLAKNTQNEKFVCSNPKVLNFNEKKALLRVRSP